MKQRTIESQTTVPCSHEPKPSDYEKRLREVIWINLIDTLKMAVFIFIGAVLFVILSAIYAGLVS